MTSGEQKQWGSKYSFVNLKSVFMSEFLWVLEHVLNHPYGPHVASR